MECATKIGIVGTGFIARGFIMSLERQQDMLVSEYRNPQVRSEFLSRFCPRKGQFRGQNKGINGFLHRLIRNEFTHRCT
jgi:hypothetical protein